MATNKASEKITLKIIASGNEVVLQANVHQPLKSLIGHALEKAGIVMGDPGNWYFTDTAGKELNIESPIGESGLVTNQTILLNQRAGAAG